jgi:cytoskeletal protein CcmA (bactofilin family)
MGSLANQYISQSYTSLIHLGNDGTASATLTALQDGLGNGLGISVNTLGDISASNTITTNNLVVNSTTELIGAFDLDTYFTASTPAYTNSTQPFFTDTVYVTGSYQLGNYPPSIADVQVGWIGNGINVTNGIVTAVSQSASGYFITMAGQFPQISQSYTFRGGISPTAKITGSLEVSENLIVSGTFDIEGKVTVNDNVRINGNLEVSGSQRNTGSLFVSNEISSSTINGIGNVTAFSQSLLAEFTNIENYTSSLRAAFTASGTNTIFTNDITASNIQVRNNLNVVGTIYASEVITLIESSSIIYSSGSNILGDSTSDTQTLNGTVIVSGSEQVTGSMGISGDLEVKGNISSSTISGIGNVTTYSASVQSYINNVSSSISGTITTQSQSFDARLDYLEGPFSASVDLRLDQLENWSSSLQTDFATTAELTSTASFLQNQINQKLNSSSFNSFTSSYNSFTSSVNTSISALNTFTASINVTTGSNTFVGKQTYSSSVVGAILPLSITSNTASMDLSLGNFFTLQLVSGSTSFLAVNNIQSGQTITLRVTQPSVGYGNLNIDSNVKFPQNFDYTPTQIANAIDVVTFVSFDSSSLLAVSSNNLI